MPYQLAIIHSKMILVDDFYAVTGSYNINVRSSRADMECAFYIQCNELGRVLAEQFYRDLDLCMPVIPNRLASNLLTA